MSMLHSVPGPLDGMKVVDFTQLIAGPSAACMLGDLGATVSKIERVDGELGRSIGAIDGVVPVVVAFNRGKQSLAVDLSNPRGVDAVTAVVNECDVLIEGFRPGVMDRLGLGYESVSARNPRIIYASLSGFGPADARPGVDAVIQASSGIMSVTGRADEDPTKVGFQVVDAVSGLVLAQAVLAALLQRERTGRGAHVDVSLMGSAVYIQSPGYVQAGITGVPQQRQGNTVGQTGYPTDMFATAGGGFVMVAAYFPDQFRLLCSELGVPDVADDPRFIEGRGRILHQESLRGILAEQFARQTKEHWEEKLGAAGVICTAVRDQREVLDSAARERSDWLARVTTPSGELRWLPRLPYVSSSWTPTEPQWNPPEVGEHSEQVLRDAGVSQSIIDELVTRGVVGTSE